MEETDELLDIFSDKKEKIITNYDENPLKSKYIKIIWPFQILMKKK